MSGIGWGKTFESSQKEVRGTDKLLFMFFHSPVCGGCKKTLEMTFKDPQVAELINRDFVPLDFLVTEAQDMTARYKVEWTPTFVITDENGAEDRKSVV